MSRIADIQTTTFHLPMKGALRWGKASTMASVAHVLVRVITDDGHTGIGEAPPRPTIYGETPQSVHTIIQDHLAPRLIGRDLTELETLSREMGLIANNHAAKGALDIAMHEALAASRGQSLRAYLRPAKRQVKVSYILGIADRATMLAEAKAVYEQGVRVLKVKVGRNFAEDLATIRTLNTEFAGSDMRLYADANEGFTPETARAKLKQLADLGLLYVEEPLPVEQIKARAALRASNLLPMIGDDSTFTPGDLTRELAFDTFDILNIKTARTGYSQSLAMLEAATAHGKGVMVGSQASSTTGIVRAALFAGLTGIDHPSELSFFLKLEDDIVTRPIVIKDGFIDLETIEDIAVDEQRLRRFAGQAP